MVELSPKCILNTLSVLGEAKDIITNNCNKHE